MEHHSNIVPWHFLRERQGAVIKWAPVDEEGNFLFEEFAKLLTPRTRLVAITGSSTGALLMKGPQTSVAASGAAADASAAAMSAAPANK